MSGQLLTILGHRDRIVINYEYAALHCLSGYTIFEKYEINFFVPFIISLFSFQK